MTQVLVLVGSQRDGFNAALARTAISALQGQAEVTTFDRLPELPHYHEGIDADGVSPIVDEFRQAVADADAVLMVTPEYNGGPSSLIKNALDVASRPYGAAAINGKPVAVIGATPSPGATQGARAGLITGLGRAQAVAVEPSVGIANAHEALGENGYGPEVLEAIRPVLDALLAVVKGEKQAA